MFEDDLVKALEKLAMRFPDRTVEYLLDELKNHNGNYKATVAAIQGNFFRRIGTCLFRKAMKCFAILPDALVDSGYYAPRINPESLSIKDSKPKRFVANLQTYLSAEKRCGSFYLEQAEIHRQILEEYFDLGCESFQKRDVVLFMFYCTLAEKEHQKLSETNYLAASMFLSENSENKNGKRTLNIKLLDEEVALLTLDLFLNEEIRAIEGQKDASKMLSVITGQDSNSEHEVSSRKQLVKHRVVKRGLYYFEDEDNSELLTVLVCFDSFLITNEIVEPEM